jgi:2-polyprenyl-3-methyl-5-hydroxy-6-metoxy-1,4-benzoquinol methylase
MQLNNHLGHSAYSTSTRIDIFPLFDQKYNRVLDVGCSTGNTGAWLKQVGLCDWITGVEPFKVTAAVARGKLDHVIEQPIESALDFLQNESFDCILCLDVLEHLVDPWQVVEDLAKKLRKGGVLITSIPNIRHVEILFNLVVKGRFQYQSSGILDHTHLRFFTHHSAAELVQTSSLKREVVRGLLVSKSRLLNQISLGLFQHALYAQYLMRSRKVISNIQYLCTN